MSRKRREKNLWWTCGAVFLLILLGRAAVELGGTTSETPEPPPGASAKIAQPSPEAATEPDVALAPDPGPATDSVAALERLQAARQIVDVHEHIESIEQAPTYLAAMDRLGIEKILLMGSSWFTITLDEHVGFTRYDWNNDQLLEIVARYPGRFEAWPTVWPEDPDALARFKAYVGRGATGLKLYAGHGYLSADTHEYMFHTMAMDDPRLLPLYAFCEENFIPVCIHANPGPTRPGFAEELVAVIEQFPDMKVDCPHFMLSSINFWQSPGKDSRLCEFFDTFPNLYTDISFGRAFMEAGLKRISKHPEKFRRLFAEYPDRIMFGADLVLTEVDFKTEQWVHDQFRAYLDMLTRETYTTPLIPGETLHGLALPGAILEQVLYKTYERFVSKRPQGTEITRSIVWENMGVKYTGRQPGEALPPPKGK